MRKIHAVPAGDQGKREKDRRDDRQNPHRIVLTQVDLRLLHLADLQGVLPQHLGVVVQTVHAVSKARKLTGAFRGKKVIFVLGEYFAHVEKLLVIGMEHEQLPTDRDQGPLQLFWQSVEKRLLDCRKALLKILQIEHILLDQRFQKREKQVEDIGSIERFFREEEALQSRKCLFVGCQNKLPPVEIKRKRECKVKRMRLVRDGKRSDQAVRQQLCAAVFDALRLQTAPEKRKSGQRRAGFGSFRKRKQGKPDRIRKSPFHTYHLLKISNGKISINKKAV